MRYEIKKLLFRKEVWIVFVLSIIALIILSFRQPWASFSTIRSAHKMTAEYYSLSLDEAESKIAEDLKRSDNESDLKLLDQMQKSIRSYKKQEANMKNLLANMYHEADHASTEYERRDLEHAIRQYNHKIDYHPCDAQQLNIAFLWLNDFEWLHYLYPLIICTLLAPLFAVESESGMYQLLFISKKGKKQLFRNKILSGIICSAFFSLCYTFLTFVLFWIRFGLSFQMLFAPIQCAEYYQNCPFSMTIWQFLILTSAMRMIVGALLTALTAIISSLFNRTAIAFGATVSISGIFIMISRTYANEPDAVLMMKRLGLFRLPILGSYLTEYDTANAFGYPVEQMWLSIACTCSVILVLLSAAYIIYNLPVKEKRRTVKLCSVSKS